MKAVLALLAAAPLVLVEPSGRSTANVDSTPLAQVGAACSDRIETVREERGLPRLDRAPAVPGQGYLIAAVDRRIEGCSVMVMRNDLDDIRPLPRSGSVAVMLPAR